MSISAKIVADSISKHGIRLTTMELNYPRFIHSEFMTHRMFSRNASSSRAIPIEKMLEQVSNNPAMPIHWGKNQSGMQAREETNALIRGCTREEQWLAVAKWSLHKAKLFAESGYHKQIVNRLLEPFQYIKVIVTATEWDNFFKLRLHKDAQPEMYELARVMKEAMIGSVPEVLEHGEWHLPYVPTNVQEYGLWDGLESDCPVFNYEKAIKCSVARCARVSYLNHDNSTPNIDKDIALADMLLEAGHMSPLEHVCTPMQEGLWAQGMTHLMNDGSRWSSNLREWVMYRNIIC